MKVKLLNKQHNAFSEKLVKFLNEWQDKIYELITVKDYRSLIFIYLFFSLFSSTVQDPDEEALTRAR